MDFNCPNCASHVEQTISNLEGVEDVAVHFTTGRVEVEYDEAAVTVNKLEQTIENHGYTPQPA